MAEQNLNYQSQLAKSNYETAYETFSNQKSNGIPLTFILVALLFLTKEFANIFAKNSISEFAHIIGGIMGALFGFLRKR